MIEGKTCSDCAANMVYDSFTKNFVCPFCGKSELARTNKKDPLIPLAAIDELIAGGRYTKASEFISRLLKSNRNDPRLFIRALRAELKSGTVADALSKNKQSDSALDQILERPQWQKLNEFLPAEEKKFVFKARNYVERCKKQNALRNELNHSIQIHRTAVVENLSTGKPGEEGEYETSYAVLVLIFMFLIVPIICMIAFVEESEFGLGIGFLIFVACYIILNVNKPLEIKNTDRKRSAARTPLSSKKWEDTRSEAQKEKDDKTQQDIERMEEELATVLKELKDAEERIG